MSSIEYIPSATEDLVIEAVNTRLEKGLTQKDLAAKLETTQSVVSRFENLGRQPTIKFVERVAKALGLRFRATLDGEFMYLVPKSIQQDVRVQAERSDQSVSDYLSSQLTGHLNRVFARSEWKLITSEKISQPTSSISPDCWEKLDVDFGSGAFFTCRISHNQNTWQIREDSEKYNTHPSIRAKR